MHETCCMKGTSFHIKNMCLNKTALRFFYGFTDPKSFRAFQGKGPWTEKPSSVSLHLSITPRLKV